MLQNRAGRPKVKKFAYDARNLTATLLLRVPLKTG